MRKLILPFLFFFFLYLLSFGKAVGANNNKIESINVHIDKDRGFLNYTGTSNEKKGLFHVILEVLKKETALEIEIKELDKEKFEESVDQGIADIVMGIEDYKRNNEKYYYLDKPIELSGAMITNDEFPIIDSNFDFSDKRFVFVEGDNILNKALEVYRSKVDFITKPSIEDAINSIVTKEADVYVEDLQDALRYLLDHPEIDDVKLNHLSSALKTKYYIGGKKEYKDVIEKISVLLEEIELDNEFYFKELMKYTKNKIRITKEITSYIQNDHEIRVYLPNDSSLYPMYYNDSKGDSTGLLVEYFSEISKLLDITVIKESSNDPIKIDINPFMITINGVEIEEHEYLTTEPYYDYNIFLYNKVSDNYISVKEELGKYKIAVAKNSVEEKYFYYKNLEDNLIIYSSYKEGLKAVSEGKADIFAGSLKKANDTIEIIKVKNLKIIGNIDDKIKLEMGIGKDQPLLYFLINSFDKSFPYLISEKNKKILERRIEISKDYMLSILITLISLLGFYTVRIHFNKLKQTHLKLQTLTFSLVETLESASTYNDEDTGDHIKRINKYSRLLAEKLKMKNTFINEVGTYASLHDIGKIGISDTLLKKPGKLTVEEFEEMKKHTEIGYEMIKNLKVSSIVSNIVRYHHEKWDGSGYPKQLSGEEIPLEARIVALADVYDALRQKRAYKEAYSHEKAVDIISSLSGRHFDPNLVEVFIKIHLDFKEIFKHKSTL